MSSNGNGNNNNNNGPVPGYPDEIVIENPSFLIEISDFFKAKHNFEGKPSTLKVSRKGLFGGDQDMWKLFVTLFFPKKVTQRNWRNALYNYSNYGPRLKEDKVEEVDQLFDFLMINRSDYSRVLDILSRNQYIPHHSVRPKPSAYLRQYSSNLGNNNNQPNENNYNYNENENNYPEMGYANDEEEELVGKMSAKNFKKYGSQKGGKTRKAKKSKKSKSRKTKHTRRT